jgi:L-alanine-DL-glutamate epimerase-like enolase superfamily enzyme
MPDAIDRIDVWACNVPLPEPLDFGAFSVTSRRYVALRVRTAGGLAADVVGHSRGSPIDVAILDLLGPEFIGTDPGDILRRVEDFHRLTIALERDGVLGRAWSLLELAMQGLRAAAQGVPVWQLFGGSARELPVQLVEGYALSNESDESFAHRLIMRVSEGYRALKVEGAHYQNWRTLARRLELTRREAPDCRLVVDFAWSWRAAREHVDALAALGELGVDWIEDAFPLHAVDQYLLAGKLTRAPIGCGDEATRVADLMALVEAGALQVVRLDATALGGFSAVLPLTQTLAQRQRRVSLHDFPEIHQHAALAGTVVDHIEMFPRDRPFDVRHRLTLRSAHERVAHGRLLPEHESGLGIVLDLDQVARHAIRHGHVGR